MENYTSFGIIHSPVYNSEECLIYSLAFSARQC